MYYMDKVDTIENGEVNNEMTEVPEKTDEEKSVAKDNLLQRIKIQWSLIIMSVLPVVLAGLVFVLVGVSAVRSSNAAAIFSVLEGVCYAARDDFQKVYPGNYSIGDFGYYSEGVEITEDGNQLVDRYCKNFDVEVSIFFSRERVLTTILDENGQRIIGTKQTNKKVYNTVFSGDVYEAGNVVVNGQKYYGVYVPLFDNKRVSGMVFAGVTRERFMSNASKFYSGIIILMVIIVGLAVFVAYNYSKNMALRLNSIKEYLGLLVKKQTPDVEMKLDVLSRHDEIGDLGKYALDVGNQLKSIIGCDPLTGLYNRRTGRQFLDILWDNARENRDSVALVMCDIDLFKKVNDTYGHDVGDEVLKKVASIMKEVCNREANAFAVRWGGEEFLLGFMLSGPNTVKRVAEIQEKIRMTRFQAGEKSFGVTMTFGVATASWQEQIHDVVAKADDNLYKGKEAGRDRIIV